MKQTVCDRCGQVFKKGFENHEFTVPGLSHHGDYCGKCHGIIKAVIDRYDQLRRDRLEKFRKVLDDPKAEFDEVVAWNKL